MPSNVERPFLGYGPNSVWVRFTVQDTGKIARTWLLEFARPSPVQLDLYAPEQQSASSQSWILKRTGTRVPSKEREVKNRYLVLPVSIEPRVTQTFYLRLVWEGNMTIPLTLWTREAFVEYDHDAQIVLGLYYGIVLVMVLYNLFLYFSLRDSSYFYYVLAIGLIGIIFAHYNGVAREYLWPESTVGYNYYLVLFAGLVWVPNIRFLQTFLLTRVHAPRLHKGLTALIVLSLPFLIAPLVDLHRPLVLFSNLMGLVFHLFALSAGLITLRKGYRPAKFYLIAFSVSLLGGLMAYGAGLGLLPWNFLTSNCVQIGYALQAVLLSLALADRINLLREEKEAQEAELQTARKMQMGLMPTTSPRIEGLDIAGRCITANHVGGDLFQYFQQGGKLAFCLADVTGHAMEAAIPVVMFSGILESEIQHGTDPPPLLSRLNRTLSRTLDTHTFVCLALGELDLSARTLRLCNAACPYPYHFQAQTGQVNELQVEAYPLGIRSDTVYDAIEAQLHPGDCVVVLSDGIAETETVAGEQFGYERTAETIRKACADGLSAEATIDHILEVVDAFKGDAPQGDDMTCVVLRVE